MVDNKSFGMHSGRLSNSSEAFSGALMNPTCTVYSTGEAPNFRVRRSDFVVILDEKVKTIESCSVCLLFLLFLSFQDQPANERG
jgi:hypothetical protein